MPLHVTPSLQTEFHPCWHCVSFAGMPYQGSAAACSEPYDSRVRSNPATGCCAWERAPGTDDEPGPPGGALEATRCRSLLGIALLAVPVEWAP